MSRDAIILALWAIAWGALLFVAFRYEANKARKRDLERQ
jgi:hypothetical protein